MPQAPWVATGSWWRARPDLAWAGHAAQDRKSAQAPSDTRPELKLSRTSLAAAAHTSGRNDLRELSLSSNCDGHARPTAARQSVLRIIGREVRSFPGLFSTQLLSFLWSIQARQDKSWRVARQELRLEDVCSTYVASYPSLWQRTCSQLGLVTQDAARLLRFIGTRTTVHVQEAFLWTIGSLKATLAVEMTI